MSMAAIEQARLAACEELLREQTAFMAELKKRMDALEAKRQTLSIRPRPKEPATPA